MLGLHALVRFLIGRCGQVLQSDWPCARAPTARFHQRPQNHYQIKARHEGPIFTSTTHQKARQITTTFKYSINSLSFQLQAQDMSPELISDHSLQPGWATAQYITRCNKKQSSDSVALWL
jgi:hypothetical protein